LQANAENLQAVQAEALAKQAAPIYGRRILLVDDDEPSLTLAAEWLSRIGLVVVLAASGEEAVELAVREQFDAVLMDLNMPRMHGYEAARHIQMKLGKNSPPIIALTAAAMEQHRQASLDAGMVDHLVKPIGPAGLLNALLHWIKPVEAAPARTLDDGELARLASSLLRLRRLLAGNEFAAIDAAEDIEALLEGTDLSKPFRPTCEAVRGLRSKDALAALTLFQKHVPPMPEIKS
jgi:CheY-like chemotaxis protein